MAFVLVGTSHPGNVGAAARAIKTMGFADLRLVDAVSPLEEVARARATGAEDLLARATVHATLDGAVGDCHAVIGTTARMRHLAVEARDCRDLAESFGDAGTEAGERVALVFGRERSGLTNAEIERCTHLAHIPCNPDFSSLNLGSAVQVMAYEWARAFGTNRACRRTDDPVSAGKSEPALARRAADERPVTSEAMGHFLSHLERVMVSVGFLDPARPRHTMRRMRRYFERNRPSENELAILRGVLSAVESGRSRRHEAADD